MEKFRYVYVDRNNQICVSTGAYGSESEFLEATEILRKEGPFYVRVRNTPKGVDHAIELLKMDLPAYHIV